MPYPQLELYVKDAILTERFRAMKGIPFWLRTASIVAMIGGIGAGYMPSVFVGGVVLALIETKRSTALAQAMREGDLPAIYTLQRLRKWRASGELEAALGTEACELLERCAAATRRILTFYMPEILGNKGADREEIMRVTDAANAEMKAALRLVGRPMMFRMPPDEAILHELEDIAAGLEQLADALTQERKTLRESAVSGLLQEIEDRKQARVELGS